MARPALLLVLLYALTYASVRADDPVSSGVSFNREIIRIVQRKCEPCHAPGGLAMSLSNYRDARSWGRAIREELVEHRMPPAIVARGYGRYESDPSLTAREMATFLTWLDGGMPRGDDADLPPPTATDGGEEIKAGAGLRLQLPAQVVPAGQPLAVRRVTVDASAVAGHAIARVEFRPGSRRVLRGALMFAALSDRAEGAGGFWIGSWLPWQHAVVPPQMYAFDLPPRAKLVVDLYYQGADAELTDNSAVDLVFAPGETAGRVEDVTVQAIPAPQRTGQGTGRARGSVTLSQATTIWAMHPAFDASVSSLEVRAERPDKSVEVLLWIPKARTDWPLAVVMQEPLLLPAGSTISLMANTTGVTTQESAPQVTLSVLKMRAQERAGTSGRPATRRSP
jgi:hypothetical protein